MELLTQEIEVHGTPLERIAFVTHTVAAKKEIAERITDSTLVTDDKTQLRYFRTIHGICYLSLGLRRQSIIDNDDFLNFADYIGIPFSRNFTGEVDIDGLPYGFDGSRGNEILAVRQYASAVQRSVSEVPEVWPKWADIGRMREVITGYKRFKEVANKFDYVDMIEMFIEADTPIDADVLFLDEAQDLSAAQWRAIEIMKRNVKRMYVAGDDDQAIYSFIGADRGGFLNYGSDEAEILPKTYRLKRNIWDNAQRLIRQVKDRQDKPNIDVAGEGGTIDISGTAFTNLNPEGSTMIIARHHALLADIHRRLLAEGIPHEGKSSPLHSQEHTQAVYYYIRSKQGHLVTSYDAALILRYLDNKAGVRKLRKLAREEGNPEISKAELTKDYGVTWDTPWYEYMARKDNEYQKNLINKTIMDNNGLDAIIRKPGISLTTFHGSKGREADHTIVFTDCFQKAFDEAKLNPDDEIRLAYVGLTRAKERVTIVRPKTHMYIRSLI